MSLRDAPKMNQMRGHVLTSAPAAEPVSVDEMRAQLLIDGTADDALLAGYITEARQEIEDTFSIAMVEQSWRIVLDNWPNGSGQWWDGTREGAVSEIYANGATAWVEAPRWPLVTIDAVSVFSESGVETAVTVADTFDVDVYRQPGRMALKRGQTWPIAMRAVNAIQIDYTAGFASVPAPIKRAIKAMVAHMYSHRGDGCTATDAMTDSGAAAIMAKYKVARL